MNFQGGRSCGGLTHRRGWDKIVPGEDDSPLGANLNEALKVLLRDQPASSAALSRLHPAVRAGAMNAEGIRDLRGSTQPCDDVLCRFHDGKVALNATFGNGIVAQRATDAISGHRYNRDMARKRAYKTPPMAQINQWVRDAIEHAEIRGKKVTFDLLADALTKAKIGQTYDKSMVQKMTTIRDVKASEARVIAEFTGYPIEDARAVAVAGKVGAGAKVDLVDAYSKGDGLYHVACPPQISPHGIVAVEVEGTSMAPTYEPGSVLFYRRDTIGVPTEAIGRICVCEDEAGMAWVKQVKIGAEEGTFSLISLNPEAENMHGVRLTWAAPVRLALPPEFVQKI